LQLNTKKEQARRAGTNEQNIAKIHTVARIQQPHFAENDLPAITSLNDHVMTDIPSANNGCLTAG
jgi:hypothetical protein